MIAKLHSWIKLPIRKGEPLNCSYNMDSEMKVKRPKPGEKHNAFAAEEITSDKVSITPVNSPIDISLVSNA